METIYKADPAEEVPLSWWRRGGGAPRQPGFSGGGVGEEEAKEGPGQYLFPGRPLRLISA